MTKKRQKSPVFPGFIFYRDNEQSITLSHEFVFGIFWTLNKPVPVSITSWHN